MNLYTFGTSTVVHGSGRPAAATYCGCDIINSATVVYRGTPETHDSIRVAGRSLPPEVTCQRCQRNSNYRAAMAALAFAEELPDAEDENDSTDCGPTCVMCYPSHSGAGRPSFMLVDEVITQPMSTIGVEVRPMVIAQPIDPEVWKLAHAEWRRREAGRDTNTILGYCQVDDCGRIAVGMFANRFGGYQGACKRCSTTGLWITGLINPDYVPPVVPEEIPAAPFTTRRGKIKSTSVNRRYRKGA